MRYTSANRGFPAGNPIANALVIIVGTLVIVASIVLGFFAFVVLGSAILIMAAVIAIRIWWFKRKLRKQGLEQGHGFTPPPGEGEQRRTIEGEYHVIVEEHDDSRD